MLLAISAVAIPQLATHSHSNHTYAGMVLLILFVIGDRILAATWMLMVAIFLYAHLASYQLGVAIVTDIGDKTVADGLLRWQVAANAFLTTWMAVEPATTVLSVAMFACVLVVLWRLLLVRVETSAGPTQGHPAEVGGRCVGDVRKTMKSTRTDGLGRLTELP